VVWLTTLSAAPLHNSQQLADALRERLHVDSAEIATSKVCAHIREASSI